MSRPLLLAPLLLMALGASAPALADETDPPEALSLSGGVTVVSDYRFRGLSQSAGDPALQGSLRVDHESGFYAGLWASTLKRVPRAGNAEVDLSAGWAGDIGSGLTLDVGAVYYAYPDRHSGPTDFAEVTGALSTTLGPANARLGVSYAWDQKALGDDNLSLAADLDGGIPNTPLSLSAHLGYSDGALSPRRLTGKGQGGGIDYALGARYALSGKLTLGATYMGVEGRALRGFSGDTVVGTLALNF